MKLLSIVFSCLITIFAAACADLTVIDTPTLPVPTLVEPTLSETTSPETSAAETALPEIMTSEPTLSYPGPTETASAAPDQPESTPTESARPNPTLPAIDRTDFTTTINADFELNGSGDNVDSIAFWEAPNVDEVLMFTTSKANQVVEVWRFPFVNNEQIPLVHATFGSGETKVNGVVVDQESDLLYVSISDPQSTVSVFSLPDLNFTRQFIAGAFDLKGEPNIDLLKHSNGEIWAYVSADKILYIYNALSGEYIDQFQPDQGLETVLADDLQQIIYVPDENDRSGVHAYHPDGTPYQKDGSHQFGANVFQADAEGILLYHCPADGPDDGSGFIVVSDQINSQTEFEFFDRQSWDYLGNLRIEGVSNTDGIASTQLPLPGYPMGIFAAINDDNSTVGVGWEKVFAAMGISCENNPQ